MSTKLDVEKVRQDFPILKQTVRGQALVYFDSAATAQKPRAVIDRMARYYEEENANVHRGVHFLSETATREYENARKKAQSFIHAASIKEVIFVRGTTEAINLVAQSFARPRLKSGDQILITALEHHSNIVPWQMVCEQTGAELVVAPIDTQGEIVFEKYLQLLDSGRVKFVAMSHVSNALGTINPVAEMIRAARAKGAATLVDGAQAAPHFAVDVQSLDCDFYAFSGHKVYGPTGIGVLYGRESLLREMPPYQGGGDMISSVTFEKTTYNDLPYKFEAGTPAIAEALGLAAAIDYIQALGWPAIQAHDAQLLSYATEALLSDSKLKHKLRLVGTAKNKVGVISFVLEGIHPHDAGTILDRAGIAVRAGHHCAQPVMDFFGIPGSLRASFGIYNTEKEIDLMIQSLHRVVEVFQR